MAERPSRTEVKNSSAMNDKAVTDSSAAKSSEPSHPIKVQNVSATVISQASLVRSPVPGANTSSPQQPQSKQVLTVDQLMAGLSKGQIRLASTTATSSDHKEMHINEILKMAALQSKFADSIRKRSRAYTKSCSPKRAAGNAPPIERIQDTRPRSDARNAPNTSSKQQVEIQYTKLTEPPDGYMTVFMPIKQSKSNIRPILVPRSYQGCVPLVKVTAQIPSESEEQQAEDQEQREDVDVKVGVAESVFCSTCNVYYSPQLAHDYHQHQEERQHRSPETRNETLDQAPPQNPTDTQDRIEIRRETETRNENEIIGQNNTEKDLTEDNAVVNDDDNNVDNEYADEDYVLDIEDDDDDDEDYRPTSVTGRRKTRSSDRDDQPPMCSICNKPYVDIKDHSSCSKVDKKIPAKQECSSTENSPQKNVPKCSVCGKPYLSYNQHMYCSGARSHNEKSARDGQLKTVEIQRIKRRRRVHRFLRLNFTLNPEIPDPPKTEFVGSHVVKDEDDLLEKHFQGGEERPPLGLTCYVCSQQFKDDLIAYTHYTTTKCGPKYIGKVLFRSKNRAENRPNNIMVEKAGKQGPIDRSYPLKRNYYNAFKEKKIVGEDGTSKKDHICTACGDSFANEEAVKEHYDREHRWRCKLCGDIYVHMKGVQLHYNRSHGKSYCVSCHVLFDSPSQLQLHMRTHQKRLCDLCGQVLANKHHYNKHMLKQHNVANAEPLHHEVVKTKPQPRGLCEICGKEYSWPFLKTKHMASHLTPKPIKQRKCKVEEEEDGHVDSYERKTKGSQVYPFRCSICSRGFQRSFYYNQHLERHSKGLACDKCGLFFAPHVDRQKHLAECLDNICAECGEYCSTKEALKRHKQTHPGPDIRCNICNREFASKFLLKNHSQIHKQYQCKVCAKRFAAMDNVRKHKCYGKKFECRICGQKFSSIKMSKQHAKMDHNRDGMDVFTKTRIEFQPPDEEPSQSEVSVPLRMTPVITATPVPPLPGPSHAVLSGQASMTAHEVSQALMTLHDFPMTGYSPVPINMARDSSREPGREHAVQIQGQLCKFPTGASLPHHPPHPPPGYPGSYF